MAEQVPDAQAVWSGACQAAAVFAVDPMRTGIVVRDRAGIVRDNWLQLVKNLLPVEMSWRRIPPAISDDRLLGGIDFSATLEAGRPIFNTGIMAELNRGVALLPMAERLRSDRVAQWCAVIDNPIVQVQREGASVSYKTCFAVVALDEGADENESLPPPLADRLAMHVSLEGLSFRDQRPVSVSVDDIAEARTLLPRVELGDEELRAICSTALALGVPSMRASMHAVRCARAMAALNRRRLVDVDDVRAAVQLVLFPRATQLPETNDTETEQKDSTQDHSNESPPLQDQSQRPDADEQSDDEERPLSATELEQTLIAAAASTLSVDVLNKRQSMSTQPGVASSGRSDSERITRNRGRPVGVGRGDPRRGDRINLLETLRVAAPWQRIRRQETDSSPSELAVIVKIDDIRVTRFRDRISTTNIFVVDASGSQAMRRMAEVKGAVELLLAESYVRRDRVALVSFSGQTADVILPPTQSLSMARKRLNRLPGGGGTPLACGLATALSLAQQERSQNFRPLIVLMTDGKANVDFDGNGGRPRAMEQARSVASQYLSSGYVSVLVDTGVRPAPAAKELARVMGATYVALPYCDATSISDAVREHAG